MRCEVPNFKRCCCFIPLRYGILVFGYLNLLFTSYRILLCVYLIWLEWNNPLLTFTVANYRGVDVLVQMWLPLTLYALEVIFNVILLFGTHTKRHTLIRIYYYYGIWTTVAIFLTFLTVRYKYGPHNWYWITFEYCSAFPGFVLQVYLLMLIRTELQKLKEKRTGHSYENTMTEVALDPPPFGDERNYV